MEITEQEIKDALAPLAGLTKTEIADYLEYFLGHEKALCGDPGECAVAKYLAHMLGITGHTDWRVSVGSSTVSVYKLGLGLEQIVVHLDQNVIEFIHAFDYGEFPHLVTEENLRKTFERIEEEGRYEQELLGLQS